MLREDRRERPTAMQTVQLLQTGLVPLVLATGWKCCNHKGLRQLISERQASSSTPSKRSKAHVFVNTANELIGQILRELRHSIEQADSVDGSFYRLDRLHLLLEVGTPDNLLEEPSLTSSENSVENYFVNAFLLQATLFECEDFLEVILHYRLNPNACGTRFIDTSHFRITPRGVRVEPPDLELSRLDFENTSMIYIAAFRGHVSIVKTLLIAATNPNSRFHV